MSRRHEGLLLAVFLMLLPACSVQPPSPEPAPTEDLTAEASATATATATHTVVPSPSPTATATQVPTPEKPGPSFFGDPSYFLPAEAVSFEVGNDVQIRLEVPGGMNRDDFVDTEAEKIIRFTSSEIAIEVHIRQFSSSGLGQLSLGEFTDYTMENDGAEDFELSKRSSLTTEKDLPTEVLLWEGGYRGGMAAVTFVFVHEHEIGFSITYIVPSILFRTYTRKIGESIDSLEVGSTG